MIGLLNPLKGCDEVKQVTFDLFTIFSMNAITGLFFLARLMLD